MHRRLWGPAAAAVAGLAIVMASDQGLAQPPGGGKGKGGFGFQQARKLIKDYDKDGDGWLNKDERAAAREAAKQGGGGGFGKGKGGFGKGKGGEPGRPGVKVSPADVTPVAASTPLYEPGALRTLFLEFENPDWEAELQDFHGTDVDVPATLLVDGKRYPNVGVHFRGMSSYGMVPAGSKRSLNLSLDMADSKQRLYGYKTLNLLNSHEDPSYLSTVLYSHIARQYIPTPKANMVKVVINGENWGVYVSAQQFNKEFVAEHFKTTKGARWKVRGSPGGGGGLEYSGDNVADYKRRFEIKSKDDDKDWKALIELCRVLAETPADKLEAAVRPILDVEGALWFLALDVALVNNDGYWVRASDYSLYRDESGKFHVIPHDMNEAFSLAGMGGGPGMGGPGRFAMGPPPLGQVLPQPFPTMLNLTDAQKKQLDEFQKDVDGKLDKILTPEQRAQLKAMREGGPGGFGPPGGGPGGPGGFGPPGGGPGGPGGFGPPGGGPGGPGGFGPPGGGGPGGGFGRGGPGGGGVTLDPLVSIDDPRKPLRSKLLAVPALRASYLTKVRTIAEKSLDWKVLGPLVSQYRSLIEKEVQIDTRKLESFEDFQRLTADAPREGGGRGMPVKLFVEQRSRFLLNHAEVKKAP